MKNDKIKGGKADNQTPESIAKKYGVSLDTIKKEIEIGLKIEKEHTSDAKIAFEIVLDHLFELPNYYSNKKAGLIAMEKKLGKIDHIKVDESRKSIKKLLREGLDTLFNDSSMITLTVKYNGRIIGNVEINPNVSDTNKYMVELSKINILDDYDEIEIVKNVILGIWKKFTEIQTILIIPEVYTEDSWSKIGATKLNDSYYMFQRGH
jgi:hypothetical protein